MICALFCEHPETVLLAHWLVQDPLQMILYQTLEKWSSEDLTVESASAGPEASGKDSSLSHASPGLEGVALRDWSTDEAYSERPSGEGKLQLPALLPLSICAVMATSLHAA